MLQGWVAFLQKYESFFFFLSNSWCVHPKLRCTSVSFSATRLGGWDISYLLSWVLGSTPYLALFHGFLIWFHWFHCACWLVSLRWFDMTWCHASILVCWDWMEKRKIRFLVQYSSCPRCFKLMVEVRTFFLMALMALSCPRHLRVWIDMMIHEKSGQVQLLSPIALHGSLKNEICKPYRFRILLFRHGSSLKQSSLMDSAIAYVAQRICTEAVSAWFLPSDDLGTTSMSWQRMGMKLTSVTWHWQNICIKFTWKNALHVVNFVETLKPKSIHSIHRVTLYSKFITTKRPPNQNLQFAVLATSAKLWMSEANRSTDLSWGGTVEGGLADTGIGRIRAQGLCTTWNVWNGYLSCRVIEPFNSFCMFFLGSP